MGRSGSLRVMLEPERPRMGSGWLFAVQDIYGSNPMPHPTNETVPLFAGEEEPKCKITWIESLWRALPLPNSADIVFVFSNNIPKGGREQDRCPDHAFLRESTGPQVLRATRNCWRNVKCPCPCLWQSVTLWPKKEVPWEGNRGGLCERKLANAGQRTCIWRGFADSSLPFPYPRQRPTPLHPPLVYTHVNG